MGGSVHDVLHYERRKPLVWSGLFSSTPRGWSGWSGGRAGPSRAAPSLECLGGLCILFSVMVIYGVHCDSDTQRQWSHVILLAHNGRPKSSCLISCIFTFALLN